ncbi:MAG TPA: hypothetical protein DEP87_03945 [Candidatus Pacebacteria bacterium]|nr:hypothetical protein [Candidatus Paceibacterota bacterium]
MLTKISNFICRKIQRLISLTVFPNSPTSRWLINFYLAEIKNRVSSFETSQNLGWLLTPSHPFARKVASQFMSLDQNHLGNWSINGVELWSTRQLEKNVIDAMVDLYQAANQKLEGYFTSGSTEGNIYAAWQGRNYLQTFCPNSKIDVIGTDLSHYSIKKAANLLNLPFIVSPLNDSDWNLDPNGLYQTLEQRYKKGQRGFLVSLTMGYTQTGTSDKIEPILKIIRKLRKNYPETHFYVWIDAALLGFVLPFIENFTPFESTEIGALVVDFHKFAQVPYPAGGVFYRSKFRKYIEQDISYLPNKDNTLLGSRPGYTVAATWAMIQLQGKAGFSKIVKQQLEHKAYFLKKLLENFPKTEIISAENSLTCGLIFHDLPNQSISKATGDKYGFFAKPIYLNFAKTGRRLVKMYKIYFLPHSNIKAIDCCLAELASEKKS